ILAEHLATRRRAGLFDVSHMGRIAIDGADATAFLRAVLSNDAARLSVGDSHYTLLPDAAGGALDDAWLCRFDAAGYLLVVNAANRERDWSHLTAAAGAFGDVRLRDLTAETAMLALQGPAAADLLAPLLEGALPAARRNACAVAAFQGATARLSRTGYTGEPVAFEVMLPADRAEALWNALVGAGAAPVGLGARDTLRLEAALPLFGHELGTAPDGRPIPIFAIGAARFGVDLTPGRDFPGRQALAAQAAALAALKAGTTADPAALPWRVVALAIEDKGIARAGAEVALDGRRVGWVSSGTMVPYWCFEDGRPGPATERRAIALALVDSACRSGQAVTVRVRDRDLAARIVPRFLDNRTGPYAVPVLTPQNRP
ncbi:MAG: glycine cleavage system protein T, partial [Lentisphaerae bacterium]|nr:glycine cleavage system protein T [Lentisphaerota bacterium]